jgi:glycosyltransferase involved in cell wall biosynthesis
METVSVIIPTWNRASTIEAAVRSVLNQAHPVLEVLVCDDGSTDETRNIISSLNDDRVKFIEGPRAGRPAIPRNRGISLAKGNWIAFLDSDDTWLPGKIEKQLASIAQTKSLASCTNAFRVLPGKGRVSPYLQIPAGELSFERLVKINYVICSSSMVHSSVLKKTNGFPEDEALKAVEDFALWLRVSTHTAFSYLDEPLVDYSDDPENSIRVNQKESMQRENVILDFWKWCEENNALTAERRKILKQQVRAAMKNNGRSFFERLKIK